MEHRHMAGIRKLFPDPSGTRIIFIDDKSDGYVLNPVSGGYLLGGKNYLVVR